MSARLRILNHNNVFFPKQGGTTYHVDAYARHSTHDHSLITDMLPGLKPVQDYGHLTVYRIPPASGMGARRNKIATALNVMRRERARRRMIMNMRYDVLHLHVPHVFNDLYYMLNRYLPGQSLVRRTAWRDVDRPVVATFHNPLPETKFLTEADAVWARGERRLCAGFVRDICRKSEAVMCVEGHTPDILRRYAGGTPVHSIPSGIDLEMFRPVPRDGARARVRDRYPVFDGKRRVLLYLGRLDPEKGVGYLAEASMHLPPDMVMAVAGTGTMDPRSDRIVRLGFVPDEILPLVISASDFVISPALCESTTRVTMQGMACGVPVIMLGRHLDRRPVFDGRNAIFIDNVSEIGDAVDRLESPDAYGSIRDGGLETSRLFDIRECARRVDDIYEDVCSGR